MQTAASSLRGNAPRWPIVAIAALLALMVLIPIWEGDRRESLRTRTDDLLGPARTALLQTERALAAGTADLRGYLISGDTAYLRRVDGILADLENAFGALGASTAQLGPDVAAAVNSLERSVADWTGPVEDLISGKATRGDIVVWLQTGQHRYDEAAAVSDRVGLLLETLEDGAYSEIRASERLEDILIAGLAAAALAVSLFIVGLLRRIEVASSQLAESEGRFRQIAESLRQAIWISDPGYTTYYYLNPAQEKIWGRSMASALQDPTSFLENVHPDDRDRVGIALRTFNVGDYDVTYRTVGADGDVQWIWARAYPVRDAEGNIYRIAGIAEDITTQKVAEEQREAALRVRDQVLRIVSHDLKNLLHTVGLAVDLMELQDESASRNRQLAIIRRTIRKADELVHDLLDASRLESGRGIVVDVVPTDMRPILTEISEEFALQAVERGIQLQLELPERMPTALVDPPRIGQVLSNLLANALKFTPEGGYVHLRVTHTPGAGELQIEVADTGRGIPSEILEYIFEPFAQARDSATLGTGLGLSIVKGIVEAHEGTIRIKSSPGQGSTFFFTIPVAEQAQQPIS